MKEWISMGVVVLATLSLAACGNSNAKKDKDLSSVNSMSKKIDNGSSSQTATDQIHVKDDTIVNPKKGTMKILGFKSLSYKNKPAFAVEWQYKNTSKKLLTAKDIDSATHTYFQKNGNSEQSIENSKVYILNSDQADYTSVDDSNEAAYDKAMANYSAWGDQSDRSSEDKIEPGKTINLLGEELIVPVSKADVKVQVGNHDDTDTDVNMDKDNFTIKYSNLTSKPFTNDLNQTIQSAVNDELNK